MSEESMVETVENNDGDSNEEALNNNNNNNNNTTEDKIDEFPVGMRVLLVDDSVVCLKIITSLLVNCRYNVTSTSNSAEALTLLKQNVDNFDIVLTDVHMDDIDGFKLLEAGLELDIPVIMVSAIDSAEIVKKGVRHGARDFLIKPLREQEIRNIWQHVYRKNISTLTPKEVTAANLVAGEGEEKLERRAGTKRKAAEEESSRVARGGRSERIRWSKELHETFVDVVETLGGVDKAVPKKILEMMGSPPGITREKVASHLQKYRKGLKKNEGEGRAKMIKNSHDNYSYHNGYQHLPPIGSHSKPTGPPLGSVLTGGMMASTSGALGSHTPSNYSRPMVNNNWLVSQNQGYNQPQVSQPHGYNQPQPLQVMQPSVYMQHQQPVMRNVGMVSHGTNIGNDHNLLTQRQIDDLLFLQRQQGLQRSYNKPEINEPKIQQEGLFDPQMSPFISCDFLEDCSSLMDDHIGQ